MNTSDMKQEGTEIERRFMVDINHPTFASFISKCRPAQIEQFYIANMPKMIARIRLEMYQKPKLTIKGPKSNGIGIENTYTVGDDPITIHGYRQMMEGNAIFKTRFTEQPKPGTNHIGPVWEIDQFHGSLWGLWIAEIELPSIDTEMVLPTWIGREVTNTKFYSNAYLSQLQRSLEPHELKP